MNKEDFMNLFSLKENFPQDWDISQMKRIVATKITDGPHETPELVETGIPFISAEAIKHDKIDYNLRRGYITEELHKQYSKKCKPQKNDIFIIKSGATTGNVAYVDVDFEFNIWSPLALVRCEKNIVYYKFLYYQLLSDIFRKQVELSWSFGTQENIGMRVIERLKVLVPNLTDQRLITVYLDKTCEAIDSAIEAKRKQLDTLEDLRKSINHKAVTKGLDDSVELKDSGVEWIGKVPCHWTVDRIKDVIPNIYGGGTPSSSNLDYWIDGDIVWITPTDLQDYEDKIIIENSRRKITRSGLQSCSSFLLPPGSVIMASRATIGIAKIAGTELCTNQGFISFVCNRFSNKFLYYLIEAYLGNLFANIASGTTFREISRSFVKKEYIAFPRFEEQKHIAAYLDTKNAEIIKIRDNLNTQISNLKQYRKSLIHECVTGKRGIKEKDLKGKAYV